MAKALSKKSSKSTGVKSDVVSAPKALTATQANLIDALHHKEMVITIGPAGTGKTYISTAFAAYFYKLGKVKKIVITRPTVPTGRSLGFFPGTLEEKMAPWVVPFTEVLIQILGKGAVECMLKNGGIEIVPFETIRGRTFNDSFVILDEAQNTTHTEIKAFCTRLGEGSTTVVNGDLQQSDLKEFSGLKTILDLVAKSPSLQDNVACIEFLPSDIVRSGLCKLWVQAFN